MRVCLQTDGITLLLNLGYPRQLWQFSRQLKLGGGSTARLFAAYYLGRRPFLQRMAPSTLVIDVPGWGKVPVRPNSQDHQLLNQMFVDNVYRLKGAKVRRIVDLGANIGVATVYMHRIFPEAEIACVEPSVQNIPVLKQAIALNGIKARVFEAAIGPSDGTIDLFLSAEPDCTSVVHAVDPVGVVKVAQVSMATVMQQMGWDEIDLLKIDIEGAERTLLTQNHGWLDKVGMVVGESHVNVGYEYDQMKRDLSAHGFALETLIEGCESYGVTFQGASPRAQSC